MRRLAMTCALVAVAAVTSPIEAQVRTTSFGVSGGLSLPLSGALETAETGYNITGSLYIRPARYANLGFRGDLAWDKFSIESPAGSSVRVLGFVFSGLYNIPLSASSVRPYVLAGAGFYSTKATVVTGPTDVSASDSNLGYNLGGGIAFQLSGFSTFLEAKWVNVMTEPNGTSFAPLTFGIRF